MEDKMKILMTTDTMGGVWSYVMSLCKSLERYNVEIHLLSMGGLLTEEQKIEVSDITSIQIYESTFNLNWMQGNERDLQSASQWLSLMYTRIQPDLIHFNNYNHMSGNWNCPVITVYHSCLISWWTVVKGENPPKQLHSHLEALRNTIEVSDVVVFPTQSMLDQGVKAHGSFRNSHVIFNGLDSYSDYFGEKEYMVLSVGSISDEGKNIEMLSKIAGKIDWPLCIAGNNDMSLVQPLPNVENVYLLGHLPHAKLQHYMDRAAIFVAPAIYEPFGVAVLEAAKSSCALVLADIPSFREVWGDAAIYFNPEEEDEVFKALQYLISDERLRMQMAKKAYERSLDFSARNMGDTYMELYETLQVPVSRNQINVKIESRAI